MWRLRLKTLKPLIRQIPSPPLVCLNSQWLSLLMMDFVFELNTQLFVSVCLFFGSIENYQNKTNDGLEVLKIKSKYKK